MKAKLEILTKTEIKNIQTATHQLLEEHGIRVMDPEGIRIFEEHGATGDPSTQIVKIPEKLLRSTISKAPREFAICGRRQDRAVKIEKGKTTFSSVGTAVQVLDLDGRLRHSTLKDTEYSFRLLDALPNIKYASWTVWPRDVPQELGHVYEMIAGFRNTTKPFDGYTWGTQHSLETIELAKIVAGGEDELRKRPMLLGFANPVSPLTLSKEPTQGIIVYAKYGQPLVFPPECQAGGTAPATLAGLLIQQNAEVLASVVLAQLVNPGTPVLYGTVSTVMDMKSGNIALGAPEAGLIGAATVQVAHSYGLPCRATGGNTESTMIDYQAGCESSLTLLMPALAGAEFIYDAAGSLESSLTMSFEKLVLDDEICGEVYRILEGLSVNPKTMATEVIENVGAGGSYLTHPHTLRSYRSEHYFPWIFNRNTRATGGTSSERGLRRRANSVAREILASHVPEPLAPDIDEALEQAVREIKRRKGPHSAHT